MFTQAEPEAQSPPDHQIAPSPQQKSTETSDNWPSNDNDRSHSHDENGSASQPHRPDAAFHDAQPTSTDRDFPATITARMEITTAINAWGKARRRTSVNRRTERVATMTDTNTIDRPRFSSNAEAGPVVKTEADDVVMSGHVTSSLHGREALSTDDASSVKSELLHDVKADDVTAADECAMCGKKPASGKTKFYGKFCSKRCIARNASKWRKSSSAVVSGNNAADTRLTIKSHEKARKHRKLIATTTNGARSHKRRRSERDCALKHFDWCQYLTVCGAVGATGEIFRDWSVAAPFPRQWNQFQTGWLMEAVDPLNQSVIGLVAVVQTNANRLLLHFEGFLECYDFWQDADSPFLFPCGFCELTGRRLHPPKTLPEEFEWRSYVKDRAAPDEVFPNLERLLTNSTGFKVGDKVEAVDRQNTSLICVATIVDAMADLVLVHFDQWEHKYDYWCHWKSPLLKPVRWCGQHRYLLSPPRLFPLEEEFEWDEYLHLDDAKVSDPACFEHQRAHKFKADMKLEAVDQRNPGLVRVATIVQVHAHQVLVRYDGWDAVYDLWMDADSGDLHPVGWCEQTRHRLEAPRDHDVEGCPTPGCNGAGHVTSKLRANFRRHHSEFGCPYSLRNLGKHVHYDRLEPSEPAPRRRRSANGKDHKAKRRHCDKKTRSKSREHDAVEKYEHDEVVNVHLGRSGDGQVVGWQRYASRLPGVRSVTVGDVKRWTVPEVAKFVARLTGSDVIGELFEQEELDGEALLLLTQKEMSEVLRVKLGPALKIHYAIMLFKLSQLSAPALQEEQALV